MVTNQIGQKIALVLPGEASGMGELVGGRGRDTAVRYIDVDICFGQHGEIHPRDSRVAHNIGNYSVQTEAFLNGFLHHNRKGTE